MSDYSYALNKDTSKGVPLYHHEQVPFHSFSRPSNNNNNMTSPLMKQQQQQQPENPVSGDLQEIIYSYQTQPELLRLILLSKLEEDKRRAEEAKLRAKELDLLLIQQQQQQQQQQQNGSSNDDPMSFNNNTFQQPTQFNTFSMQPTPPISSNSSTDGRINQQRRTSLDAILASPYQPFVQCNRRDSTLGSSFTGSADSDEFDDRTFSPIPTTTTPVSASSLLQMER
jgi:hypothetical protein